MPLTLPPTSLMTLRYYFGHRELPDQVQINQVSGMEQPVSQAGDSGSVWVDMATNRAVALNFAGDTEDLGVNAVGNPILQVINQLNIRFNS